MIYIDRDTLDNSEFFSIEVGLKNGEILKIEAKVSDLKFLEVNAVEKKYRKSIWAEDDEENINN
jgi:hypothetical protein